MTPNLQGAARAEPAPKNTAINSDKAHTKLKPDSLFITGSPFEMFNTKMPDNF
jgi:hypothetical protein